MAGERLMTCKGKSDVRNGRGKRGCEGKGGAYVRQEDGRGEVK